MCVCVCGDNLSAIFLFTQQIQFSLQNILANVTLVDADDAQEKEKEKDTKPAKGGEGEKGGGGGGESRKGRRVTVTLCREILPHAFGVDKCANCFQPIARHTQEALDAYYSGETQPVEKPSVTTSASNVKSAGVSRSMSNIAGDAPKGVGRRFMPASQGSTDLVHRKSPLGQSSSYNPDAKKGEKSAAGYQPPSLSHSQSMALLPSETPASRMTSPLFKRKESPPASSKSPHNTDADPSSSSSSLSDSTGPSQRWPSQSPQMNRDPAGSPAGKSFNALEFCTAKPKRGKGGGGEGAAVCLCCCQEDLGELVSCVTCQKLICGRCMTKRVCHTCSGRDQCPFNSTMPTNAIGGGDGKLDPKPVPTGEGKSGSELMLSPRSLPNEESALANLSPRVGRNRDPVRMKTK